MDLIFERKKGRYTNRALFYQDILRYSEIQETQHSFKDRKLAYWLLKNNYELRNHYSEYLFSRTPAGTRVDNILPRAKTNVQGLPKLNRANRSTRKYFTGAMCKS